MQYLLPVFILFLSLQLTSCGDRTQEESARESMKAAEQNLDKAREAIDAAEDRIEGASEVLDKAKMYCCTNHEPPHCGTALEMEELINTKGCSGFEEQGITAD